MKNGTCLLAVALLSACGGDDEAARPDHFHVDDGAIRDAEGRTVLLRGLNLASAHKSAPYFGFHEAADFDRVRAEWGMNALRFLISWAAIEPERGEIDHGYLDAVAERMDWARDAGLVVVLDMHQDLFGEGFSAGNGAPAWACSQEHYDGFVPTDPWFLAYSDEHVVACYDGLWGSQDLQEHYAGAWAAVAARLHDHEAVIGFDIMNEPYWGSLAPSTFESDALTPFYETVVAAVRAAAPKWLAFVEPSSSRNLGIPTAIGPFSFEHAVYAPHSYDSGAEQGGGFDAAKRNGVLLNLAALANEADALGMALWIGEYGGVADDPGITDYMDAQYDGAASALASSMYWAYDRDGGYGVLTPDGEEKPALLDALVRPYPERVAGDLLAFDFDEQSRTFVMRYAPDETVSAVSEISVPKRAYPDGFDASCGDCVLEADDTSVRIVAPASGSETELRITPR